MYLTLAPRLIILCICVGLSSLLWGLSSQLNQLNWASFVFYNIVTKMCSIDDAAVEIIQQGHDLFSSLLRMKWTQLFLKSLVL